MDFTKMYEFQGNLNRGLRVSLKEDVWKKYNITRENHEKIYYDIFTGKIKTPDECPFIFEPAFGGTKAKDIVTVDIAYLEIIISKKVVTAFQENNLTGWSTYPVKVFGKDKKEVPNYYGLVVTGKCGPIDATKSRTRWSELPHDRIMAQREGSYFDPETWDGKDFFLSPTYSIVMVTEKVKKVFNQYKLTNAIFTKLTEVKFSHVIGINADKVKFENTIIPKPTNWPNEHLDEYPPCILWQWGK